MPARVILGDCKDILKTLDSDSFDSLVTDPPAGISFMGKAWDSYASLHHFQEDMTQVFREALRVLKPGAHGLVWALPRTSAHTGLALANAGFEIRDMVMHLFGAGMPKSFNVAKAGAGEAWEGWGTGLKPAHEVWWLVRKPLNENTVVKQVLSTGTGAINVDKTRVQYSGLADKQSSGRSGDYGKSQPSMFLGEKQVMHGKQNDAGRWPANVVLSHSEGCTRATDLEAWDCQLGCAVAALDEQSGELRARGNLGASKGGGGLYGHGLVLNSFGAGDVGGASRFFYTSKIMPRERRLPDGSTNDHPTAKSIKLMRYFVRLITQPGGTVLDPFAGSGTTGVASLREAMNFVGIEQDPEHHRVAELRLDAEVSGPFDAIERLDQE